MFRCFLPSVIVIFEIFLGFWNISTSARDHRLMRYVVLVLGPKFYLLSRLILVVSWGEHLLLYWGTLIVNQGKTFIAEIQLRDHTVIQIETAVV